MEGVPPKKELAASGIPLFETQSPQECPIFAASASTLNNAVAYARRPVWPGTSLEPLPHLSRLTLRWPILLTRTGHVSCQLRFPNDFMSAHFELKLAHVCAGPSKSPSRLSVYSNDGSTGLLN